MFCLLGISNTQLDKSLLGAEERDARGIKQLSTPAEL
jgi:hypothetical protein